MTVEVRKIIQIDEEKCNGCGLCIPACAEGALQIVNGKARLINDRFCDGLGNCLGECPRGAITIIERQAESFDQKAVEEHLNRLSKEESAGCSSCSPIEFKREEQRRLPTELPEVDEGCTEPSAELTHWPVQLALVSPQARFLKNCNLLIAADCVPFAFADFHRRFLRGKSLLVGCSKLDDVSLYQSKLTAIFRDCEIAGITVVQMEIPCCFGLSRLIKESLQQSGAKIPVEVITIGVEGTIKESKQWAP